MVTTIDDYIDKVAKRFPSISREDIKRVLELGFTKFHSLTKSGADILIKHHRYTAYCGKSFIDDSKRAVYNYSKRSRKLRLEYNYALTDFDGWYYFCMDNEEFTKWRKSCKYSQNHTYAFKNIKLFKLKEEALMQSTKSHFFMIHYPVDFGWTHVKKEIKSANWKYFAKRDEQGNIVEF